MEPIYIIEKEMWEREKPAVQMNPISRDRIKVEVSRIKQVKEKPTSSVCLIIGDIAFQNNVKNYLRNEKGLRWKFRVYTDLSNAIRSAAGLKRTDMGENCPKPLPPEKQKQISRPSMIRNIRDKFFKDDGSLSEDDIAAFVMALDEFATSKIAPATPENQKRYMQDLLFLYVGDMGKAVHLCERYLEIAEKVYAEVSGMR